MSLEKYIGTLIHPIRWEIAGGGERNVADTVRATRNNVNWKIFGKGDPARYLDQSETHYDLGMSNMPNPSVLRQAVASSHTSDGTLVTTNNLPALGVLPLLHRSTLMWQSYPIRPDIGNPLKRNLVEMRQFAFGHFADHHVIFSPAAAERLHRMGVPNEKITLLPQILHPSCAKMERTPELRAKYFGENDLGISISSRITNTKGVPWVGEVMRAMDQMLHRIPEERKVMIRLFGNASNGEESKSILNGLYEIASSCTHVRFEYDGLLSPDEVYERLSASDAVIAPGRTEGYSVALIEALASGCPIMVRSMCEPNVDVAQRSKAGIVVDNSVQAAEVALQWLSDPSSLEELRVLARNFVRETTGEVKFTKALIGAVFRNKV